MKFRICFITIPGLLDTLQSMGIQSHLANDAGVRSVTKKFFIGKDLRDSRSLLWDSVFFFSPGWIGLPVFEAKETTQLYYSSYDLWWIE